ncbi:MAG: hypothetical protein Q4F07_02100 [Bacteroidales bacterium]|nr:hypothetical protein [Bacteroidales bacterium]
MKAIYVNASAATGTPVYALAPDSAVITRGNPWFMPSDGQSDEWRAILMAAAVIDRLGKHIPEKFVSRYYSNITIAAHPHNPSVAHDTAWIRDGAIVRGEDIESTVLDGTVGITCQGNDYAFDGAQLRRTLDAAVVSASEYMTLRTGDMVMVPVTLPAIPLAERMDFEVAIGGKRILRFKTR